MKFHRKLIAFINRTFVADCPRCHKHFYGHQAHHHSVKLKDGHGKERHYRYVCDSCLKEHSSKGV